MVIASKFNIGQIVYLITDEMQLEYIVVAIVVYSNFIKYKLAHASSDEVECLEYEIAETKIIK